MRKSFREGKSYTRRATEKTQGHTEKIQLNSSVVLCASSLPAGRQAWFSVYNQQLSARSAPSSGIALICEICVPDQRDLREIAAGGAAGGS